LQRRFDAQFGVSAAGNELLRLDEEFDLADAAAAELDIVPFDRDFIVAAIGVDLPLHRVHVGNRREVEIFAPDERRERSEERLARHNVARTRPRLDQRGALPILSTALVIVERRRRGDGDLGRGRIGTQPQVDAEHVAVDSTLLQQLHQRPREPNVKCRRLRSRNESFAVVEDDEIDVARIVELAGPHLAHGEHDIARALTAGLKDLELGAALRIAEQVIDRSADGRVGERSLQVDHLRHRPNAADVGERNQQRRLRLHVPKQAHHLGFIACRCNRALCVGENILEAAFGFGFEKRDQPLRRRTREIPEIGRAARQPRYQRVEPWVSRREPCQRLAGGQPGNFSEPALDACPRFVRGVKVRCRRDPSHKRTVA
jgi:hypothetical protein